MTLALHPLFPPELPRGTMEKWQLLLEFERQERFSHQTWNREHHITLSHGLFEDVALFLCIPAATETEDRIEWERAAIAEIGTREEMFNWSTEGKDSFENRRAEQLEVAFHRVKARIFRLLREVAILRQAELDLRPSLLRVRLSILALLNPPAPDLPWEADLRKLGIPDGAIGPAELLIDEALRFRQYKAAEHRGYTHYGFSWEDRKFFFDRHELWPWTHLLESDIDSAYQRRAAYLTSLVRGHSPDDPEKSSLVDPQVTAFLASAYRHRYRGCWM